MKTSINHSFEFNDVHIAPGHQIDMHRQSSWELSYVSLGSGVRTVGDDVQRFNDGDVVLVPPDIPHQWSFDADNTDADGKIANITLTFYDAFLDRCASLFHELGSAVLKLRENTAAVKFGKEKSAILITLLEGMRDENDAERVASVIRILVEMSEDRQLIVVGRKNITNAREYQINQIKTYVACNFCRAISIDDIALHIHKNRTSFCRFFRQNIGMSFVNYVNEYRITIACELLKKPDMNISQVCFTSGFNDIPYFCRVFHRIKGMSPRQFRATSI
jgi:AraC-like DNA-binding protein